MYYVVLAVISKISHILLVRTMKKIGVETLCVGTRASGKRNQEKYYKSVGDCTKQNMRQEEMTKKCFREVSIVV